MKRSTLYLRAGAMLLALLLALMLTACGSDDDGEDTDTGAGDQTEQPADTGESEAADDSGSQLAVTAQEFEFTGISDTVPAGETTVNFTNAGKQPHEFILFALADNAPPLEELLKMSEKEAGEFFLGEPQTTFAKPGKTEEGAFTAEFESGAHYAYVCFVQDPKTKKPHAFLGMNGEFTVE